MPESNRKPTDGIRRRKEGSRASASLPPKEGSRASASLPPKEGSRASASLPPKENAVDLRRTNPPEQPTEGTVAEQNDVFPTRSRTDGDMIITERQNNDVSSESFGLKGAEAPSPHDDFSSRDDNRFAVLKKWFGGKKDAGIIIERGVFVTERKIRGARRPLLVGVVSGGAAVVIAVVVISTVFARVTIIITPRVETISVEDRVFALDTSVSKVLAAQSVVPAEYLTFSRTVKDEFEATGSKFVEEKARGSVRVYNRFSSSPQTLVEKTRFVTDSGVLYRLSSTIRIPGAKVVDGKIVPEYIETELVADEAGEGANRSGEVHLTIPGFKGTPKYEGFSGTAPNGFEGGFRGTAHVVTSEDIKSAQEQVTKRVVGELKQEVVGKVPPDFKLIEALQEIQVSKLDTPPVGSRASRFTAGTEAKASVFVFRETDITEFLKATVLGGDTTKEIVGGVADIQYGVRTIDFRKGRAELIARGTLKVKSLIPEAELIDSAKGKKEGSIVEFLKSVDRIAQFRVSVFPPWRSRAPNDADKIRVVVEEPMP